jgi:hypothetical protein
MSDDGVRVSSATSNGNATSRRFFNYVMGTRAFPGQGFPCKAWEPTLGTLICTGCLDLRQPFYQPQPQPNFLTWKLMLSVIEGVTVSVAVSDCVPTVLKVTEMKCRPLSEARNV